ncbi:MAG: response regulator transcription factor [Pseudomonadota bacterium]
MSTMAPARDIVLLVDDSPETLGMLTEALETAGLTVLVARDGETAIGLLDRVAPDLVLLDALMPGIDGFETCRRIKQDPRFAATPVIFMTGLSESADIVRGLSAGGVDYVTKPVDCEALIARIAVHAANARIVAEARTALDMAGRAVLALSPEAEVQWASPRAEALVDGLVAGPATPVSTRHGLADWLERSAAQRLSELRPFTLDRPGGAGAELAYLARTEKQSHLVRVAPMRREPPGDQLSRQLGVTPREGEVLSWLADGKANRDIASILDLSPRTVTKHLEQIYTKLGVENRTAAVAIAIRALED